MNKPQTKNDLVAPVPKFCLGLEVHRRTAEGRVRTAEEFLTHFFPHNSKTSTDRIFKTMPIDVRAPILTAWGVRGRKSAFRDDDAKVQSVVHDALVAGDIDANMFENALGADTVMRWVDLSDWWAFWRAGKILTHTLLKALESAYELGLFDADWFIDNLRGNGGKLRGTDVLAEGLSKADLTEWVRNIHQTQDGSAKGLIAALGWDQIAAKTADEILLAVLDALAVKVSLAPLADAKPEGGPTPIPGSTTSTAATPERKSDAKLDAPGERKSEPKVEPPKPAEVKVAPLEVKPEIKVEAKLPEARPLFRSEPKLNLPKPVAKVEPAPPAPPPPAAAPAPAPAPAAETAPPEGTEITAVKQVPQVIVPWQGIQEPKDDLKELAFDEDAVLGALKEDELIPISTPGWDEGEDIEVEGLETTPQQRNLRRSKPPGKRPSKTPPIK